MFGLPLTIFLISPYFGVSPSSSATRKAISGRTSWTAWVSSRWRSACTWSWPGVALIATAISLIAVGWVTVYRRRDTLVATGLTAGDLGGVGVATAEPAWPADAAEIPTR
jgi:hypothetical protein